MSIAYQPSFLDLGTPLQLTKFCVVDLETTGTRNSCGITEIGAVRIESGEIEAEFSTLVNPQEHIGATVALLTGITDQMVSSAPKISSVLPTFLEFAKGTVLVAHNAKFDVGFLKRACTKLNYEWPNFIVVDTLALARQILTRNDVPNYKLHTLARFFHARTSPTHRALDDARATVDVLHGIFDHLGSFGVDSVEDLMEFTHRVSPARRAKRVWTNNIPDLPGVYWFHSASNEVLYVGKSVNLKRRTKNYFTANEKRPRMEEMIRVATGVDWVVCETSLEAQVRELRIITAHQPRYNRLSKRQEKILWVKLTKEVFPRLSIVRKVIDDGGTYWGPFSSKQSAEDACLAIYDAFPIRSCNKKLSANKPSASCALAQMGRCVEPCQLKITADEYRKLVDEVAEGLNSNVRQIIVRSGAQLRKLVHNQRYEQAQEITQRISDFQLASLRHQRLASLIACPQIVAAKFEDQKWQIHVIRYGKLAGAAATENVHQVKQLVDQLLIKSEVVKKPTPSLPAGTVAEAEQIAGWLEQPGVRLLEVTGQWSWSINSFIRHSELSDLLLKVD